MSRLLVSSLAIVAGQQTCATLRDSFQSNECARGSPIELYPHPHARRHIRAWRALFGIPSSAMLHHQHAHALIDAAVRVRRCCSATMGRELESPLHAETASTIASAPSVFNAYKFMSSNFTKMTMGPEVMANFKPIG